MNSRRWLAAIFCALAPSAAWGATFTVNTTNDLNDGLCNVSHCSLREAIEAANATPGLDTIRFIIASGIRTIAVTSSLPTITDPVTIDGTTQPGYAGSPIIEISGQSAPNGSTGLRISAGGSLVRGLVINRFAPAFPATGGHGIVLETGGNNVVRGCYIGTNVSGTAALQNGGDAIQISSSAGNIIGRTVGTDPFNLLSGNAYGVRITGSGSNSNLVAGNRIGTNAAGTAAVTNAVAGLAVQAGGSNQIGNATPGDTLISGNGGDGIIVSGGAIGTVVTNTFVGTNLAGTAAISNAGQGINITGGSTGNTLGPGNLVSGNQQSGILVINDATGNTVTGNLVGVNASGTAAIPNLLNGIIVSGADGNTIGPNNLASGNGTNGIRLRSGASNNVIRGNRIGVNASVTAAIPNADGVQINDGASDNTIGGPGADRNVISGNTGSGVAILDATTAGNVVQGNFIGSNASASAALPNGGNGVTITASNGNTIGGTAAGTRNIIAFNGGRGVAVGSGVGNSILGNNLSFNGGLGIDLGPLGVTPNDPGDPDPGANLLQNFPILTSAQLDTASTQVQGSLNSIASSSYRIEFFAAAACDASGNGPGQRLLGAVDRQTDPGGNVAVDAVLPSAALGPFITATATDPAGNTSEFSACLAVPGPSVTSITPTSGPANLPSPVSIAGSNFQNGAAVRLGGVAATGVAVMSGAQVDATTPVLEPGKLHTVTVTNPSTLAGALSAGYLADFTDVPQSNIFHDSVETVFREGITAGCGAGAYCVDSAVTRAQMSVFLLRSKHGANYDPPDCVGVFDDVPCPSPFADWIEELHTEGITAGCGGDNYCPDNPVRRDQMAVFLLKTKNGSSYTPADCMSVFADVTCPGQYANWIEQLYADGITGGCQPTPLQYCPSSSNTRGQMATFLVKTFGF